MNSVGADWESSITHTTGTGIAIGGYDMADLLANGVPFTSVVHLLHTGELPDPGAGRLLEALMVASIDHGPGTPSALAARTAVSGGANVQSAGAAGLLAMGDFHAAAVAACMELVMEVADSGDPSTTAVTVVDARRRTGQRVPGFGHRQHKERDPRVNRIFATARSEGVDGRYLAATEQMEEALTEAVGRRLPINIDGVYAAVLAEIGLPLEAANAVFITSRMAGVLAHAVEELNTQPPMRRIDPLAHRYSGPPSRPLPTARMQTARQDRTTKGRHQ